MAAPPKDLHCLPAAEGPGMMVGYIEHNGSSFTRNQTKIKEQHETNFLVYTNNYWSFLFWYEMRGTMNHNLYPSSFPVIFLNLHVFDAWKKVPKHILPNGREKWWFTMVESVKTSPSLKKSKYLGRILSKHEPASNFPSCLNPNGIYVIGPQRHARCNGVLESSFLLGRKACCYLPEFTNMAIAGKSSHFYFWRYIFVHGWNFPLSS